MPITLGPNITALKAARQLSKGSDALSKVYERLSSGLRVNRASDDPAGLAVALSLRADARVYSQAVRNVNDGISLLNLAEGATRALQDITTRVLELAEQAANGVLSTAQRSAIDTEAQALADEYNRIVYSTKFNGNALLDGSLDNLSIQAGKGSVSAITFSLGTQLAQLVGDGTFGAATSFALSSTGSIINYGDFNGDGIEDLAIGAQGTAVNILLGNGDGTYKARVNYVSGNKGAASDLTIGDVSGDGVEDIISHDSYSNTVSVLVGNGNGTFKAAVSYNTYSAPWTSNLVDVNSDGIDDLVVGSTSEVSIFIGNGNGSFLAAVSITGATSPRLIDVVDLNGDGLVDVVSGDASATGSIYVRLGNGNGTFKAAVSYFTVTSLNELLRDDFNNDGIDDYAVLSAGEVDVLLGNGNGTFTVRTVLAGAAVIAPIDLVSADFNADGNLDIAYNDRNGNQALVRLGNGNGSFSAATGFTTAATGPRGIVAFDANNDGVVDLLTPDGTNNDVSVLLGNTREVNVFPTIDLSTQSGARSAIPILATLNNNISAELGIIGANQSRLEVALSNLSSTIQNTSAAADRIMDADMAADVAEMVRLQILQNASAAILAQANLNSKTVISLITYTPA